ETRDDSHPGQGHPPAPRKQLERRGSRGGLSALHVSEAPAGSVTCAEGGYPSGRPAATVAPVHARRLAVLFLLVASGCHRRAGSSSEAGPAADGSATPGPDAAVIAAPIAAARG